MGVSTNTLTWRKVLILGVCILIASFNTVLVVSRLGRNCPGKDEGPCHKGEVFRGHEAPGPLLEGGGVVNPSTCVPHLGQPRKRPAFLTIAIPTVQRHGGSYLLRTLDSIIQHTSELEKDQINIVILLADLEADIRNHLAAILLAAYKTYVSEGFIHATCVPADYYPQLRDLHRTFGDSEARVVWRSKQATDYAYLMTYCQHMSQYYMQLEDDVLSSPDFVKAVQEFISNQRESWICLEFSHIGFIGKLYKSKHLGKLGTFIRTFYSEQPVDFLFRYFSVLMTQKKPIIRTPSLFSHVGHISSLSEKNGHKGGRKPNEVKDAPPKIHKGDNPPAILTTTIKTFHSYSVDLAYSEHPGYFWGLAPSVGDAIIIAFIDPVTLQRIVIETGSATHPTDFLRQGHLEASSRIISRLDDGRVLCTDYLYLGAFHRGRIDMRDVHKRFPYETNCLRITVTRNQTAWLLVTEVAVFLSGKTHEVS